MEIKEGVIMNGLSIKMREPLMVANEVYANRGKTLVITSALDGTHMPSSYHYSGNAVDIRTRFFTYDEALEVADEIRSKLSNDYRVLFESNHIHIQYNA